MLNSPPLDTDYYSRSPQTLSSSGSQEVAWFPSFPLWPFPDKPPLTENKLQKSTVVGPASISTDLPLPPNKTLVA